MLNKAKQKRNKQAKLLVATFENPEQLFLSLFCTIQWLKGKFEKKKKCET